MFWIIGGEKLFAGLFLLLGWDIFRQFDQQMHHSVWHGLTFYDLIFPLFIFLSGMTLGITQKPMRHLNSSEKFVRMKTATKRLFALIMLGILYNHGWGTGIPSSFEDVRFASVLARIGIAWYCCAWIVWYFTPRIQGVIAITILLGYWLLLTQVPVPGIGASNLTADGSINAWVDQHFLPGITYQNKPYDPEGLLSSIPAIVNALAGALLGRWIKLTSFSKMKQVVTITILSIVFIFIGYSWNMIFPMNKELWTSSFTVASIGYCGLLFSFFYLLIDVLHWRWLSQFFVVIGVNSILIYLLSSLMDWNYFVKSLFGQWIFSLPTNGQLLASTVFLIVVQWLFLWVCFKRKILLKV